MSNNCATAADIWAYMLSNGKSAGDTLTLAMQQLDDVVAIEGLVLGDPLNVSPSLRTAAAIVQLVTLVDGIATVTRTA
jgi:hypothetical protein